MFQWMQLLNVTVVKTIWKTVSYVRSLQLKKYAQKPPRRYRERAEEKKTSVQRSESNVQNEHFLDGQLKNTERIIQHKHFRKRAFNVWCTFLRNCT